MQSLLLLVAVVCAVLAWNWYKQAPPARQKQFRNRGLLVAGGVILLVGVMSGRLHPALAAIGAAIPAVLRLLGVLQGLKGVQGLFGGARPGGPTPGQASQVETPLLRVSLDHDTGRLDGEVLNGRFIGRMLSTLNLEELRELYGECQRSDSQSVSVLQAYLDRHEAGWREQWGEPDGANGSDRSNHGREVTGRMSIKEAADVLGLPPSATREEVIKAHRRLIQKLHPDRGGSDFLAAKINEAKDILLSR